MRLVWLTGIAALLLSAGLAWYLAPLEPGILVLQFAFTPQAFAAVIHAWSPADLARYRSHLPPDFVLLAAYGAFGYLLVARSTLFAGTPARMRGAARWLLPVAAAFDVVENGLHWWLSEVPRFGVPLPYLISAGCATAKWLLLLGFAVAVLYSLYIEE